MQKKSWILNALPLREKSLLQVPYLPKADKELLSVKVI